LTLDGKPALFQTYSLLLTTDDNDNDATKFFGNGSKTLNLLLYVVKTHDEAAIIGIVWPGDCVACATGPESAVRRLNPDVDAFMSSSGSRRGIPGTEAAALEAEHQEVHQQRIDDQQGETGGYLDLDHPVLIRQLQERGGH